MWERQIIVGFPDVIRKIYLICLRMEQRGLVQPPLWKQHDLLIVNSNPYAYSFPTRKPHKFLDGEFGIYETLSDLPHNTKAVKLLRTLAAIVRPHMRRYNVHVPYFTKLHPEGRNLGLNEYNGCMDDYSRYDTHAISLCLRNRVDPAKFLPLEELLSTLCHELAHIWEDDHGDYFHGQWKAIMEEVEEDLGGKIKIRRDNPRGLREYARKLRWLQWADKKVATNGVKKRRRTSSRSIKAAWKWESTYWNFEELPPAEED
jgi:hypothetical protein